MEANSNLDKEKLNRIKYQLLNLETNNIVMKDSNAAMEEKIRKMIITEVEKR